MFTIIGGDGKEYGPVTAEQIRGWIAGGRANLDTKAKVVGTEEWRRLGEFAEFSGGIGAASVPPPVGIEAQRVDGPVDIKAFSSDLIARAAPLDVFGCLSRSFELWKSNFLPLVGVTFLIILVQMVIGMIPLLGALSGILLGGVFYGGLYYYYLGHMRGEPRTVGDGFAGFSKALVPLMLASLLSFALTLAILLPFLAAWIPYFIKLVMSSPGAVPAPPSGTLAISLGLGCLVLVYFSVSWIFTFALVIDRGLGPWTAMEVSRRVVTKQWFRIFLLVVLAVILSLLGLIGLIIGVIFTMPLLFGALLYAYEDLCNPPGTASDPALNLPAGSSSGNP